jgi:hypothetical protein
MRARSWAGVAKRERERERERGLVAELPDVFRIVFCELLVLAVPIEKKD